MPSKQVEEAFEARMQAARLRNKDRHSRTPAEQLEAAVGQHEVEARQESEVHSLIRLHSVYKGGDDRDPGKPFWFFTDKAEAESVAEGRGWYNSTAHVGEYWAVRIGDNVYLLASPTPIERLNQNPDDQDEIRKKALEKLSKKERRALGLPPSFDCEGETGEE